MITRKNLIAEVLSDLKQYNESGLIDEISLDRWTRDGLLKFGGTIMPISDKVIEVKNGMAKLPENFYALYLAAKCDPYESTTDCVDSEAEDLLQSVYQYRVRKEAQREWDNQSNSYQDGEFTEITEKLYFHDGRVTVTFKYGNPQLLRLSRGVTKEKLCGKNLNLQKQLTNSCQYEMSIQGEYIQTNFNKGFIYIQFQGLPTTEEGDLIIPEVQGNYVYEYLENLLKRKILQNLWTNGDDENIQNKLNYFLQLEESNFSKAMTSAKFEGMGGRWWKDMAMKNKRRTRIYEQFALGK